jgi:hypothetical protein
MTTNTQSTEPNETTERPAFVIDSEQSAAWFLRKLRTITEEKDAIKAATTQRLAELDADEKSLTGRFWEQLQAWAQSESETRRRQTITLPLAGASVSFRKSAARVEITDQSKAIAEATERGLVKTSPDLVAYRTAAQEWLDTSGELLPGIELKPESTSFSWKPIAAKKGDC